MDDGVADVDVAGVGDLSGVVSGGLVDVEAVWRVRRVFGVHEIPPMG